MNLKYLSTSLLIVLLMTILEAKAQLGILNDLLGSANIKGTVFCTSKDNMGVNDAATPVFSNAQVQLVCGGKVVSDTTTDGDGTFSMMMDDPLPLLYDISSLLNSCKVVVPTTPLSNCNNNLPSAGGLISTLQYVGITRLGTHTIANIAPSGFHFMPST